MLENLDDIVRKKGTKKRVKLRADGGLWLYISTNGWQSTNIEVDDDILDMLEDVIKERKKLRA